MASDIYTLLLLYLDLMHCITSSGYFHIKVSHKTQSVNCDALDLEIQSNFNGSNTFGTMKTCSRQGWFRPLRVYYRARSGGNNKDIFSIFFTMKVYCVFSLESPR